MHITGKLIKINPQKKLVVKIDKRTYDTLLKRMQTLAKKLNYSDSHFAVSSYEDDFGDEQYRLKVKLDQYDILNMSKFEAYLRDDVSIVGSLKPWAFPFSASRLPLANVAVGFESRSDSSRGPNVAVGFESRHKTQGFGEQEQKCGINYELSSIRRIKPKPIVSEEIDAEIDAIAAAAEARVLSTDTKLTAEEELIDDFVEEEAAAAINSQIAK